MRRGFFVPPRAPIVASAKGTTRRDRSAVAVSRASDLRYRRYRPRLAFAKLRASCHPEAGRMTQQRLRHTVGCPFDPGHDLAAGNERAALGELAFRGTGLMRPPDAADALPYTVGAVVGVVKARP